MNSPRRLMDPLHRTTALMSYRDLLAAINRDFEVRDDARLDGPVVMAVLDAQGVVHFGHLVACSIGAIPVSGSTASAPVLEDVYTSAPRVDPVVVAPVMDDDDASTRVVDVGVDEPMLASTPDPDPDPDFDPDDFSAASDRTCILDIRSMPGAPAWATEDLGEAHTVYGDRPAGDRFDEETTTIRGRTWGSARPARPTPRDTVVSTVIGPERRPCHARPVSRSGS